MQLRACAELCAAAQHLLVGGVSVNDVEHVALAAHLRLRLRLDHEDRLHRPGGRTCGNTARPCRQSYFIAPAPRSPRRVSLPPAFFTPSAAPTPAKPRRRSRSARRRRALAIGVVEALGGRHLVLDAPVIIGAADDALESLGAAGQPLRCGGAPATTIFICRFRPKSVACLIELSLVAAEID